MLMLGLPQQNSWPCCAWLTRVFSTPVLTRAADPSDGGLTQDSGGKAGPVTQGNSQPADVRLLREKSFCGRHKRDYSEVL